MIGADGLHSVVRKLVFKKDERLRWGQVYSTSLTWLTKSGLRKVHILDLKESHCRSYSNIGFADSRRAVKPSLRIPTCLLWFLGAFRGNARIPPPPGSGPLFSRISLTSLEMRITDRPELPTNRCTILRPLTAPFAGSSSIKVSAAAKLLAPGSDQLGSLNHSAINDELSTFNFRSIDNQFGPGNWF